MAEEELEQPLSNPQLLVDNIPPDVTQKDGIKVNAESKLEYCTITSLAIVRVWCISAPEW